MPGTGSRRKLRGLTPGERCARIAVPPAGLGLVVISPGGHIQESRGVQLELVFPIPTTPTGAEPDVYLERLNWELESVEAEMQRYQNRRSHG